MADDIMANIRKALGLDVMWQKTVVTAPEEERVIFENLEDQGVHGLRVLAHRAVDPGTILVIDDDAADALSKSVLEGPLTIDLVQASRREGTWTMQASADYALMLEGEARARIAAGTRKITNITGV
jgi:hypothetical protein